MREGEGKNREERRWGRWVMGGKGGEEDGKRETRKRRKEKREIAKEEDRGTGREPQTETTTEGEKAPPLRSFSVLLALACVKCKAAG